MTAQDLKNAILQQAIQGKLLPQNPSDEPASELLKKISAERQKLIDDGKIKNPPQLPSILDDEKPFDIPESWQWVRLPEIIYTVGGKHNQILAKEIKKFGKYPVISQGQNFIDGYTDEKNKLVYDLPLIMFGDHTRNVKFIDFPFVIGADGTKFLKAIQVYPKYFYWWTVLTAELLRNRGYNRHYKLLKLELFPLPPLAEQKRIVEKLEEILPLVERYGELEQRLTKLDKEFPDKLKKSLLQQAIQGKLTRQLSTDGNADDLLEKIRAEKLKLIEEGKIKKEKPLPPIKAEETPFDIPDSWQWVRLGEIGETNIGLTYSPNNISSDGVIVLRSGNIQNGRIDYSDIVKVNLEIPENKFCRKGDILICARNGSKKLVGKAAIIDKDNLTFGAFMAKFRSQFNEYILLVINSPHFRKTLSGDVGTMTINQITQDMLKNFCVPLPPLAEQKRIVERLEELLPLCDRLREKLTD